MKKIKITKEQYHKISNLLKEEFSSSDKPNEETTSDLKQQTLDFIKYLYNKTEDLPTYDDIFKTLESKDFIIKKDGKFKLSKSLGSAEEAKLAVENEISKMVGGQKEEIEEGDWFDYSSDNPANRPDPKRIKPSINLNNIDFEGLTSDGEIAILKHKSGQLYVFTYIGIPEEELNHIAEELGLEDDWRADKTNLLKILAVYVDIIQDEAGEGLEDWENGIDLVKIDDELKNELLELYSNNSDITSKLSDGLNEEESDEDRMTRLKSVITQRRLDSAKLDDERFARRDRENSTRPILTKVSEPTQEPKKPVGQYRMKFNNDDREIDEMNTGMPGATGQFTGKASMVSREMPNETIVSEGMTSTPSTTGEYTKPAFEMKKNHTDFSESKPKAFKKTQWAGGGFVEFNDCTKLNNKPAGSGCSAGAVDNVVKIKKTKGNVNAPSLSENKIYETIAKKTGKTIDEVKLIINSKK